MYLLYRIGYSILISINTKNKEQSLNHKTVVCGLDFVLYVLCLSGSSTLKKKPNNRYNNSLITALPMIIASKFVTADIVDRHGVLIL